jgi:hypothetical protein
MHLLVEQLQPPVDIEYTLFLQLELLHLLLVVLELFNTFLLQAAVLEEADTQAEAEAEAY